MLFLGPGFLFFSFLFFFLPQVCRRLGIVAVWIIARARIVMVVMACVTFHGTYQIYLLWIKAHSSKTNRGYKMPRSWIASI